MQRKHTQVKAKAATVDTLAILTHGLLFALLATATMAVLGNLFFTTCGV